MFPVCPARRVSGHAVTACTDPTLAVPVLEDLIVMHGRNTIRGRRYVARITELQQAAAMPAGAEVV